MAASAPVAPANTDSQKVKLARNPVHDYFKYIVDKKCSQCESWGFSYYAIFGSPYPHPPPLQKMTKLYIT